MAVPRLDRRKFYFSPEDDIQEQFLQFINGAKRQILIADYSFNLVPLVNLLVTKFKAGVDVKLVLDRSQSRGHTEEPEIVVLRAAGVPMVTGTSSDHHIMHDKYAIVDGKSVEHGSWNMTRVASLESNFIIVEKSKRVAAIFTKDWQYQWDWINIHEKGVK